MAYEESFAPEVDTAPPVVADAPPEAPQPAQETAQAPEVAPAPAAAPEVAPEPANEPASVAPAFNEADFLKQHLGDDAPATASELAERYKNLQARQLTPEHESRLAVLSDAGKLAEYAQLAGKDYDKLDAATAMREHFSLANPGMSEALADFRFQKEFEQKYPTLAAALENLDAYQADDPQLILEKEAADYDAKASRTALKTAQQEKTQQFLAAQAAAPQPQLTPAQEADAKALPLWLDEAIKDGATLSVELSDGTKLALPIQNAADFKAAFNDTYTRLDAHALNADGTINRPNQALITQFLQLGPMAFVQHVAKQVLASQPLPRAAIPVDELTNASSARPTPATVAPPVVVPATRKPSWENFNV